jgi:hypothetical protein
MLNLLRRRLYLCRGDIIANIRSASKDVDGKIVWLILDPNFHSVIVKACIRLVATTYEGFNILMLKRVMFCFLLEILNEGASASFFALKKGETKANRQCCGEKAFSETSQSRKTRAGAHYCEGWA